MSEDVSHLSIRAVLPELNGKTAEEVFPFFREKLGLEGDDADDVLWSSRNQQKTIVPVSCYETKDWGVEWIFHHDYPYQIGLANVDLAYIEQVKSKILEKFPTATGFMVCSYTWYNGVEEPITMVPNFKDES